MFTKYSDSFIPTEKNSLILSAKISNTDKKMSNNILNNQFNKKNIHIENKFIIEDNQIIKSDRERKDKLLKTLAMLDANVDLKTNKSENSNKSSLFPVIPIEKNKIEIKK